MRESGPTKEGLSRGFSDESDVLDETMVAGSDKAPEPPRPQYAPGTAVSRYVILYEVGAGGMGVVYAAFDPQLNRKIALKILVPKARDAKPGQAATRLMREAQAIARLSHPNVVNVYDVGRHGEAVFVAMEFIEGTTLTRWLEHDRPLSEICRVFAMAGRGLAAAHHAGLVHRDFKPDNVLVSPDGRVRVLDFGLARANPGHSAPFSDISHVSQISQVSDDGDSLDGPGDGVPRVVDFGDSDVLSSPLTLDDTVVGTPRYMPPEQHAGVGVDGRSDQFSFCVALYQALYRQDPFPASRLQDLVRLKQHGRVAPVPPDANVPPWLGDLVMRGLRPRPADRLPSMDMVVAALEDDPQARRHRRLTLLGGAVLLVGATALVGHQLGRGDRLCRDSETHVERLWDDARRQRVKDAILGTELAYAEHTWSEVERRLDADLDGWTVAHRETCEATRVRGEQSDALLDLRMGCLQEHLGEVEAVLGVLEESDPAVVQRAVSMVSGLPGIERCADVERLRADLPPPQDEATRARVEELRALMRQAEARKSVRRVEQARKLAEQALREAETLGYEPLRVEALATLGIVLENAGDFSQSEARMREALFGAVAIGHDRVASRAAIQLVSVVGDRLARFDEGLTWAELAGAMLDHQGEDGMARVGLMNNLGNVWYRKGDNAKALDHYQRAIARREALSSPDNPALAGDRVNLGNAQLAQGEYEAALASYQQAEAAMRAALGEGHPQVAMAVASIGVVYNETGRYAEALEQHRKALPDFEAWLGPDHLFVATTIGNIGVSLLGQDRLEEAAQEIGRAQEILLRSLGPDHPHVAASLHNLGSIRMKQGRYDEAQSLYQRALEMRRKRFDEDHEDVVGSRVSLAELQRLQGDAAGAVTALEALASQGERAELSPELRGEIHLQLAQARWDAGQPEDRVRADLEQARVFLREAGLGGDARRRELEAWALEHARDDRPRRPDGSILPVGGVVDESPPSEAEGRAPPEAEERAPPEAEGRAPPEPEPARPRHESSNGPRKRAEAPRDGDAPGDAAPEPKGDEPDVIPDAHEGDADPDAHERPVNPIPPPPMP